MRRQLTLSARLAGTIFGLSLISTHLLAATFGINPVRVDLSTIRPSAVIQIENMSDERVLLQAHAVTWSFAGATDQYAVTDDILLNPPIFGLEPHQKQFVRLGLRRVNESAVERTYRLILEKCRKSLSQALQASPPFCASEFLCLPFPGSEFLPKSRGMPSGLVPE